MKETAIVIGVLFIGLAIMAGRNQFLIALNTRGAAYKNKLREVERLHNMPALLLSRVAYQESRFRADIISGEVTSHAGAVGIMQIVPQWHPDVNPLNTDEAIEYAGNYLASLKKRTGSWRLALAAYNWGIGNLKRHGIEKAPEETRNYIEEISKDVAV